MARQGFAMVRSADDADAAPEPPLPPATPVDLAGLRRTSGVDEVLRALDEELVGLDQVKARTREIAALLLVDRLRARFGVESPRPNLHMCFTGAPGTGKTTVAARMATLLRQLGYLRRGHLVAVTRDDLVGQYVGHTAPKTREVVKRAMGGVLFVDEAYYLFREDNERDYGQECVEILLQMMENDREDLVVILAGYADRMETFFRSNPGMSSRIAHHIDFPDYTLDELEAIARIMVRDVGYGFADDALPALRRHLATHRSDARFGNARGVRNTVERARLRHADRLMASSRPVSRADLTTLRRADLESLDLG